MQDVMEAGHRVEEDTITVEHLVSEAGQEPEVGGMISHEHCRESLGHLRKAFLVPEGTVSEQGWRDKNL